MVSTQFSKSVAKMSYTRKYKFTYVCVESMDVFCKIVGYCLCIVPVEFRLTS